MKIACPKMGNGTMAKKFEELHATEHDGYNVKLLGVVMMDEDGGLDGATATDNAELINEYLQSGWQTGELTPTFPSGGVLIDSPIVIERSGSRLQGTGGESWPWPESWYSTSTSNVGPYSRIVASEGYPGFAGPLLQVKAAGPVLDSVNFHGLWHSNDPDFLQDSDRWPISDPERSSMLNDEIKLGAYEDDHEDDPRPLVGIEIKGQWYGVASGRTHCATPFTVSHCRTAISHVLGENQFGEYQDNADQTQIANLMAPLCDVGIHSKNLQCLGVRVGYFFAYWCDTAFWYERGGDLSCDMLVLSSKSRRGLLITGNDGSNERPDMITGSFHFGMIKIDGINAEPDCQAIRIAPIDGACGAPVIIDNLINHFDHGTSTPLIYLKNHYGSVEIKSGSGLYDGLVEVHGGTTNYFPTIIVRDATFFASTGGAAILRAHNPLTPNADGNSDGKCRVIMQNCRTVGGAALPDADFYWVNGVVTPVGTGTMISQQSKVDGPTVTRNVNYHGGLPATMMVNTTEQRVRGIVFTQPGLIKSATVHVWAATLGSNEQSSIFLRKNTSEDFLVSADFVASDANGCTKSNRELNSGNGIPIIAGDSVALKWSTPNWGTQPSNVYITWAVEFLPMDVEVI